MSISDIKGARVFFFVIIFLIAGMESLLPFVSGQLATGLIAFSAFLGAVKGIFWPSGNVSGEISLEK